LKDYENYSLDELRKLKAIKQLAPVKEPTSKIEINGDSKQVYGESTFNKWYNDYSEKQTEENQEVLNFFSPYFENSDSDTGCEDTVDAWSPEDVYAKKVWSTAVCHSDLFQIAVKGINIDRGDGLKIQIKAASAMGDPVAKNSCECGSCTSISFSTYPITLSQYNLEAIVCEKDSFDVGDSLMESYIISMSNSWKKFFDAQIYSELTGASANTTETLTNALSCDSALSGSCCSDSSLYDLWNSVGNAISSMRDGTGLDSPMNPDYIVMSNSVADVFTRMQTPSTSFYADVKFDSKGKLAYLRGLKVITYCGASACTDATGTKVAVIVDSSRAVGAVFGKKPTLYKFFQSNCNSYRLDYWSFFGCSELSTDAIAFVVNP